MFPSFCDNQKIRKNQISQTPSIQNSLNYPFHESPPIIRRKMKTSAAGEIVPVQGGHILRSTGRKDRHSKVFTAKGPRDRRVRLSAHTAIRFYDVQDRLGYDRPSKAVDWLIKKAKFAIDKLQELPLISPLPMVSQTQIPRQGKQSLLNLVPSCTCHPPLKTSLRL